METGKQQKIDKANIRKLIGNHIKSIQNKELEEVMSIYSEDIVSFDIDPPLWYQGINAKRNAWKNVFAMYQRAIGYVIHNLNITLTNDVAFSRSLNHVSGKLNNGQQSDFWVRWTACFQKLNGNWLITHEQVSVPVDLKNGMALLNLKP
jgi:ketosteroid isomerase-like protein